MVRSLLTWKVCWPLLLAISCTQGDPAIYPHHAYHLMHQGWRLVLDDRIDILFVIDNAGSMAGKQRQLLASAQRMVEEVERLFGPHAHIAVVTAGMASDGCPPCDDFLDEGCLNDTGEDGRFQDRLGRITWEGDEPAFDFERDPACRVVTGENLECFWDEERSRGIALVGATGCPYRRGLGAMRRALGPALLGSYNAGFLRDDALLAVVFISDGEDCGEPGEVSEGIPGVNEAICSYAARGAGPDGSSSHPDDPDRRPYGLTPVETYHDFLVSLKGGRRELVRFAAIVGIENPDDPEATTIRFESGAPDADVVPACTTAGCTGDDCSALPGTRAIRLASLFGLGYGGFVDTICQADFSHGIRHLGGFVSCPNTVHLSEPLRDPALVAILFNDEAVPPFSCSHRASIEGCRGPDDTSCSQGGCVRSWVWEPASDPPDPWAPGGWIRFADHVDPCTLPGEHPLVLQIDVIYVAG